MKKFLASFVFVMLALSAHITVQAQVTGSISGTVTDQTGAVVPGATVSVRGAAGEAFTVTTNSNGLYSIPGVASGLYKVTITAPNFKTSVVENVKVDVGTPSTVNTNLQAGDVSETVVVTSGAEVLQTETPTVGSNIQGRQITETPITSRDALDLVTLLPGTNTTGAARRSTINGLPKGAISITIDGVDVQDNYLRSSDGFFTYVRPRVDAIDEVTVTSAVPGAESAGDGAVGIRFVTRRGTNDYSGGLFWQHRNTATNANYWYNNRDFVNPAQRDEEGKALRQRVLLNQFGGRIGGPIPFPRFGDGGGSWFDSGKDKAFFFVNYEEFRYPESLTRTRTVMDPLAQAGNYSYLGTLATGAPMPTGCVATGTANQMRCQRDLYALAFANGLPNTVDPTIGALLGNIRSSLSSGSILDIVNSAGVRTDLNRQQFRYNSPAMQKRTFLAARVDFNLSKDHALSNITNHQNFNSMPDMLNSMDATFPGFGNFGSQESVRNSNSTSLRSSFTNNLVNEARAAISWGDSAFAPGVTPDMFANQQGFNLQISGFGITNATARSSNQFRSSPTLDISDSLTWIKGKHTLTFGGQWKRIKFDDIATANIVNPIYFGGISSTDTVAFNMFNSTSMPGSTAAQLTEARQLYAVLTGRITQVDFWAYQTTDGVFDTSTTAGNLLKQETYGFFAQDQWRMKNNLTVNFGLRWQPQTSYIALSSNYGRLENFDQIYGISGPGNMFKPGTMTGQDPRIVKVGGGEAASPTDYNNFAPSVGVVWSPDSQNSFVKGILGGQGKSVFRAGWSRAFVREGTLLLVNLLGSNPGGARLDLRRHASFGNLTPGSLLRTVGNPNLVPQAFTQPVFPYNVPQNGGINALDPDLKTGYVDSWSAGYQRQLDRNTVIEFRYVGTRGKDLWVQHNINELNTIENGFAAEFKKAQGNLYANILAGQASAGMRYTGNPGTQALPIFMSWLAPVGTDPNSTAAYNSIPFFTNATHLAFLSNRNPNVLSMASTLENFPIAGGPTARQQAALNGVPRNFFFANPLSASGGAFVLRNAEQSWYDSAVVEVRRRLSAGLRVGANYVWGKAFTNAYATSAGNDQVNFVGMSQRNPGLQKTVAQHDIRHAFKFDATYDLPFGRGGAFFSNTNRFADAFIGGWSLAPVIRWQSGSPVVMQNVQLVGMTRNELQKEIKVRKGDRVVTFLPDDIILNTQRAYDISVATATGYGTTYGGAPEGRYIAPAGFGNCQAQYSGECGFANLVLYGPSFFKLDVSLIKKVRFTEKMNVEFKANFFDALNQPNFRIGGWGADTVVLGGGGNTFGQLGSGSAYQDVSTTNDPGGRIVEFMFRFNF